MHDLLFSCQQPKSKWFLPRIWQQVSYKMADGLRCELQEAIRTIHYENIGLQGEIPTKNQRRAILKRHYVSYFPNQDKENGMVIITRSNKTSENPYISVCRQHGYRRHEARVLLTHNQGSSHFAYVDTANAVVTYAFWQGDQLTVVDTNRPRHFRLEAIN